MAIVRENIPQASGKSSIAQMLAQRSQPPAMAAAPPPAPLNGMRGMPPGPIQGMRAPPPPMLTPAAAPPLAGATGQAIMSPALKMAMLNQIYGRGAGGPGGPMGGGGAPPVR